LNFLYGTGTCSIINLDVGDNIGLSIAVSLNVILYYNLRMCLAANIPLVESGTAGYLGQVTVIRKVRSNFYSFFYSQIHNVADPGCLYPDLDPTIFCVPDPYPIVLSRIRIRNTADSWITVGLY
jgi:hypothetical protein